MAGRRFVEGTRDNFTLNHALHLGDLFRPFIDQQDNKIGIRRIGGNALCNVLQHQRLARFRWRDDQTTLAFSNRCREIDNTCSDIFG